MNGIDIATSEIETVESLMYARCNLRADMMQLYDETFKSIVGEVREETGEQPGVASSEAAARKKTSSWID